MPDLNDIKEEKMHDLGIFWLKKGSEISFHHTQSWCILYRLQVSFFEMMRTSLSFHTEEKRHLTLIKHSTELPSDALTAAHDLIV